MNLAAEIEKRIFIVGVARSGTTLLQSMLGSHSKVFTMPEMHFWDQTLYKQSYLRFFEVIGAKDVEKVREKLKKIGPEILTEHPGKFRSKKKFTRWILSMVDQIALKKGKTMWLEKTPLNLYYTSLISSVDPKALFIHMVREPLSNIASLYEAGKDNPRYFSQNTIDACIERYLKEIKLSKKLITKENHFAVRYEELVMSPETVIKKLCLRTGINFEAGMMEYSETAGKIVEKDETWKIRNFEKPVHAEKYRKIFSEDEINYISEKTIQTDLSEFENL